MGYSILFYSTLLSIWVSQRKEVNARYHEQPITPAPQFRYHGYQMIFIDWSRVNDKMASKAAD